MLRLVLAESQIEDIAKLIAHYILEERFDIDYIGIDKSSKPDYNKG